VVVVSSYLPEVLGLADRVLVMREGTVAGELAADGATEEDVLALASTSTTTSTSDGTAPASAS
jgi:ABC-type sugar transport system ATPase subunit